MDADKPELPGVAGQLANAERELDEFERQPPPGARAYLRGRRERLAIIAELREKLNA